MIEAAERDGLLKPDQLFEATSGNNGIGLSWLEHKDYKVAHCHARNDDASVVKSSAHGAELS